VCNENEKDRQHFVLPSDTGSGEYRLDPAVMAKYVGTYVISLPGFQRGVTVTLDGDQLLAFSTDGERALLIPQSTTRFVGLRGSIMEFISNEQGVVTHLLVDNEFKVPRVGEQR
jgi:hypothetical protein